MIGHYLTSALVKFRKSPFTTGANVLTLALGLACFIAAWGVADWWRSGDRHHANADRTFVVGQAVTMAGQERADGVQPRSSPTVARYLRQDVPELEHIARIRAAGETPVAAGERKAFLDAVYADSDFLSVFDFDFVAGDPATALSTPGGVILTEQAADRLFGAAPAMGQPLRVDGTWDGVVTGVIKPPRQPSFMGSGPAAQMPLDMLASWDSDPAAFGDSADQWYVTVAQTFVVLPAAMSLDTFNARLADFVASRFPADQQQAMEASLRAFPVQDLSTFTLDAALRGRGAASLSAVSILLCLGALTLGVACVNYANLATAQAVSRTKETGLRKTLGAGRAQLMAQAWVEAGLMSGVAAVVALAALAIGSPMAEALGGIDTLRFLRDWTGAGVFALIVAAAAFAAGLYPALALSTASPLQAARSSQGRSGAKGIARVLVAIQFASATFLLVLIVVTQAQRMHLERMALAPRGDTLIILGDVTRAGVDYETLAERLRQATGVRSVSVADKPPLGAAGFNVLQVARSPEIGAYAPAGYFRAVGYDYFETFNLDVLAGRVFDPARNDLPVDFATLDQRQTPSIVLDSIYARRLGFLDPAEAVGQTVYMPAAYTADGSAAQPMRIIGVTAAEPGPLRRQDTDGSAYMFAPLVPWSGQFPAVRVDPANLPGAVSAITQIWDELAPDVPPNVRFFDDIFADSFRPYARVGLAFVMLGASAFLIASVGLIGIAVHVTARRRHEIGVRKTLGASAGRMLRMLLTDFSKPVVIGNLVAWPFAWMAAQTYLQGFAERTPLTPLPFIVSLVLTLLIAWLSVGGQAWRAASVKPALVLKAE